MDEKETRQFRFFTFGKYASIQLLLLFPYFSMLYWLYPGFNDNGTLVLAATIDSLPVGRDIKRVSKNV